MDTARRPNPGVFLHVNIGRTSYAYSRQTTGVVASRGGPTAEVIPLFERILADCERILGPDHPDTLASRNNLAAANQDAGRTTEAEALRVR